MHLNVDTWHHQVRSWPLLPHTLRSWAVCVSRGPAAAAHVALQAAAGRGRYRAEAGRRVRAGLAPRAGGVPEGCAARHAGH